MTTEDQRCAAEIEAAILDGSYPEGTTLPPERRLAESLGVSRLTLRQALARLRTTHVVAARQGSGYRVLDFWREAGLELVSSLLRKVDRQSQDIVRDLLLVRRALSRLVLERLVESPPDAAAVEQVLVRIDAFEQATSEQAPLSKVVETDLDVLAAITSATSSPVLRLCLNPIRQILRASPALQDAMYRAPQDNLTTYRAVGAWLSSGATHDGIDDVMRRLHELDQATLAAFRAEHP